MRIQGATQSNPTDTSPDDDQPWCIHELVAQQSRYWADAVAVIHADTQLTYAQLDQRANQVAHALLEQGIKPDHLVALCLERSIDMLIIVFGILKAGAAYLPIDPHYPYERQRFMIEHSQAPLVITTAPLEGALASRPVEIQLELLMAIAAQKPTSAPNQRVDPDQLAYVIYTSGSSGQPKGVMITHRALVNHMQWMQTTFGFNRHDRFLQKTPLSFDASVWECYAPLLCGGQLILAKPDGHHDAHYLVEMIQRYQISVLQVVPSLLRMLQTEPQLANCRSLRYLFIGGEPLHSELVAQVRRVLPARMINLYGPTEATIDATWAECNQTTEYPTIPIGYPIDNLTTWVLDAQMQPVAVGRSGELYIGGMGLARGYQRQPDRSAERFVPDPFSTQPGTRLYKTGDRVRLLANGALLFLDRIDQQIKLRGYRIELGEIQAGLERHPQIRQSVVVGQLDQTKTLQLVAYVVPMPEARIPIEQLRALLKAQLPRYMLPSAFVILERLPLLANGKLDRASLPLPAPSAYQSSVIVPPRTPQEMHLLQQWQELLGFDQISIDDDFFDLGGHSLLATQLVARMRDQFQRDWSVATIFNYPTIEQLAAQLRSTPDHQHVATIPVADRQQRIPLSTMQERVWFLTQLNPESRAYHFQMTIHFTGQLHVPILEQACSEIVRRHEILRTTFPTEAGQPYQQIHAPWAVTIPSIDLRQYPLEQASHLAEQAIAVAMCEAFDLTQLPLVRWSVFRLADDQWMLLQIEHHFIHDGWSIARLLAEIKTLYTDYLAGLAPSLPALPIQYADFAVWQRQQLNAGLLERDLRYWEAQLAHRPVVLELPTDYQRPPVQSMRGSAERIAIPAELANAARELSRRVGTTLFMTLLTTFSTLLYRYTEQTDILLGSGIANRRQRELEPLLGMFVNTVVLRTDLQGNPSFRELLLRTRSLMLEQYEHLDVLIEKVVERLRLPRDLSRNPLFQVMFSFHDSPVPTLDLPMLHGEILERNNGSAKADLNVIVIPYAEQHGAAGHSAEQKAITMIWEYSTDLFTQATIQTMIGHFQALLRSVTQNPDQRINQLAMLSRAETAQCLEQARGPLVPTPTTTLHGLFANYVREQPNALAIVTDHESISYSRLNQRADMLAGALRQAGVGPGMEVGIVSEPSIATIAGILAVLKLGAAYVPLDPSHPQQRLNLIINEAQLQAILVESQLEQLLPNTSAAIIRLDSDHGAVTDYPIVAAQACAYGLFTSGSTGQPKGVACSHEAVINLLDAMQQMRPLPQGCRHSLWTSLSFDVSVYEIFSALTQGGTLYLIDQTMRLDADQFFAWLAKYAIESAYIPPFMLHDLALWLMANRNRLQLKRLLVGVEPIPEQNLAIIGQLIPGLTIINGYGPTETTICATFYSVPPFNDSARVTPIGRAIQQMAVYVLDRELQPMPTGVIGDIYIAGIGLALGYIAKPDLTAEVFLPNPLSAEPGMRMYRSGDRGRYLADGSLMFVGRSDRQVKIRGMRIELNEIRTCVLQHAQVHEAVVNIYNDQPDNPQIVAYVVPTKGQLLTEASLRTYIGQKLPLAMQPQAFVLLDRLPLTANDKLDWAALPAPFPATRLSPMEAPSTPLEQILAGIWSELFAQPAISIDANFFELGGHSLLATRVASRLQETLHKTIPVSLFFQYPTIKQLAHVLDGYTAYESDHHRAMLPESDRSLLSRVHELSEQEVDQLLAQFLDESVE
ncbi:non-ribosomal peptide synthetase [Herpetosiphon sp.]|uniref:Amino acid adenylation domain n=1 Tax=Herpetosiphon aurantiacus (strain ATCC 23779 / DSM 785 / 114-95) TaxID=316274 RepID=A9B4Q2_HERA2|nr:non-ribosomal peptide synthetase [Herpetosiphon sp.]ABX04217.1 amino acid adenylation domain [Herpetosiphon aurantiacus DSM 785]